MQIAIVTIHRIAASIEITTATGAIVIRIYLSSLYIAATYPSLTFWMLTRPSTVLSTPYRAK